MEGLLCIRTTGFEGKSRLFKLIDNEEFILSRQIERVLNKDDGKIIHFLYSDEEFIGYAITGEQMTFLDQRLMWIYLLEISRSSQRKGYGSYLIESLSFDPLFVEVMWGKEKFYERNGFECISSDRMGSIMVKSDEASYYIDLWKREQE